MKVLNENTASIFLKLIQKLGNKQYIKLTSTGLMPLHFEHMGQVNCSFGVATAYSMMHSFIENGDLMRDPEMCFLYFKKEQRNLYPGVCPYSYRLDALGIDREAIRFYHNAHMNIDLNLQGKLVEFAALWLENIHDQRFI